MLVVVRPAGKDLVDVAAELDVVVGELAQLGVVEARLLVLGRGAQAEAWDEVHDEEDDARDAEGVGESGDAVGELVRELDVVAVQPAAVDLGEAIEVCDVVTAAGERWFVSGGVPYI